MGQLLRPLSLLAALVLPIDQRRRVAASLSVFPLCMRRQDAATCCPSAFLTLAFRAPSAPTATLFLFWHVRVQ